MPPNAPDNLCLECSLCCNGVIFAHGQLQPGDDAGRLRSLGLVLKAGRSARAPIRFAQPCAALEGCRCRIYSDRPQYCRQFECLLRQRVATGAVDLESARKIVRRARRQAGQVDRLLRELGDDREHLPLADRFRRLQRRVESGDCEPEAAARFGDLTLAMHRLNLLLADQFYPG